MKYKFRNGEASHFNSLLKKWAEKWKYDFDWSFHTVKGKSRSVFTIYVALEKFNENYDGVIELNKLVNRFRVDYYPSGNVLTVA